jgi:Zn-dependent protease with chaperone function
MRKFLLKISKHAPHLEYKRPAILRQLHFLRIAIRTLWLIPTALLIATLLASLERAPLTGRWRFILLSPQEEEDIVGTLTATWRSAVDGVLAAALDTGIPPPAIPANDWRHQWVESTLRRLESAVPLLQNDPASKIHRSLYNDDYPFPPPSAYPLMPRPRPAQIVHSWMCQRRREKIEKEQKEKEDAIRKRQEELQKECSEQGSVHLIGPPYSCLVVDNPDVQNAFSYGFGPGGAGGVVVYTGFIDEVLHNTPPYAPQLNMVAPPSNSLFATLFGSILSAPRRTSYYQPTEQQTSELAVLLAHELAHLLLAHHLETLSSTSILFPSVLSIFTDVARTILFPITMLFGPFVNDALAQIGKTHSGELGSLSEMCAGRKLEIEAG